MHDPDEQTVREWAKHQVDVLLDGLQYHIHDNREPLLMPNGAVVTVDLFIPYPETRH